MCLPFRTEAALWTDAFAQAQLEQQVEKIKSEAKKREASLKKKLEAQEKIIREQGDLNTLKKQAQQQAQEANEKLLEANDRMEEVQLEKAELESGRYALIQERNALAGERDELAQRVKDHEFRERIFSGSFAGLLVTAILGVVAAFRSGKAGKLENRKKELEIKKLERELAESRDSGTRMVEEDEPVAR